MSECRELGAKRYRSPEALRRRISDWHRDYERAADTRSGIKRRLRLGHLIALAMEQLDRHECEHKPLANW